MSLPRETSCARQIGKVLQVFVLKHFPRRKPSGLRKAPFARLPAVSARLEAGGGFGKKRCENKELKQGIRFLNQA
jgi:hypothetical protein